MKREFVLIILCLIIGFSIGFVTGVDYTLGLAVDKADYFLSAQGINISIKEQVTLDQLWRYRNQIGTC